MTQPEVFSWHARARLFAGAQQIARPAVTQPTGLRAIVAASLPRTLTALGGALDAGDPFYVATHPLPDVTAKTGEFLTLTGGSTGTPKAICRTQASWRASFAVNQRLFDWQAGRAVATLGHPVHSLALYAIAEALHLGRDAHVLADFTAPKARAHLAEQQVETLYATPAQLWLLAHGRAPETLPDLRDILCGGGKLDSATQDAIVTLCPNAQVRHFYGAAETSFITLSDGQTPRGSVGRAYPDVSLKLRNSEVWVRSPYLCEGYANSDTQLRRDADGYVTVGELGEIDAQGHLWITGRADRQVQIADQSVSPEQVEEVIATLTDGQACAVVAVPDARRGARLVAAVHGAHDAGLAQQIKARCQSRFGPLIAPRQVVFLHDWPSLPSGKTDLAQVAQLVEDQP